MILSVVSIIVAVAGVSEATICKNDTDCGMGECCYIQPEFLIASRRQLVLPAVHDKHDTGVCEKYRVLDEHCGVLETANGHCGCGSGMSCQWVPVGTVTAILPPIVAATGRRRSQVYHPEPGAYQCAPRS